MKKLLVATDFSATAYNAVDFAIQSAKIIPADVIILHIYESTENVYYDYMGLNKEYKKDMERELSHKLDLMRLNILESEALAVKTVLLTGDFKEKLEEAVNLFHPDLLIMGSHGVGGFAERLMGNKASASIGQTSAPLLLIPYAYNWKKPRNILLASNHLESSRTVNYLSELADLYMAKLKVAIFTSDKDPAPTILEHDRVAHAYEHRLKDAHYDEHPETVKLRGDSLTTALETYINEHDVDIVAMVTQGSHFFHPSQTKRMSYYTNVPLLAIPHAAFTHP